MMNNNEDKNVGRIITVATPYWGSAATLERLVDNGVTGYPSKLLGVFSAIRTAILSFPLHMSCSQVIGTAVGWRERKRSI